MCEDCERWAIVLPKYFIERSRFLTQEIHPRGELTRKSGIASSVGSDDRNALETVPEFNPLARWFLLRRDRANSPLSADPVLLSTHCVPTQSIHCPRLLPSRPGLSLNKNRPGKFPSVCSQHLPRGTSRGTQSNSTHRYRNRRRRSGYRRNLRRHAIRSVPRIVPTRRHRNANANSLANPDSCGTSTPKCPDNAVSRARGAGGDSRATFAVANPISRTRAATGTRTPSDGRTPAMQDDHGGGQRSESAAQRAIAAGSDGE
jgi:hypothetical protein